ncbi:hypothetical protein BDF14DRAFT_1827317 [Spinellus fusiger]|nr:hypothetical protein BDF14DRAFT_1827317 [Spinellus fusiger]
MYSILGIQNLNLGLDDSRISIRYTIHNNVSTINRCLTILFVLGCSTVINEKECFAFGFITHQK